MKRLRRAGAAMCLGSLAAIAFTATPASGAAPAGTAKASAPGYVKLRVPNQSIPVSCSINGRKLGSCDVTLVYRNTRGSFVVGTGRVNPGARSTSGAATVPVVLNSLGHYLAALGPVPATALVKATPYGSRIPVNASARTQFVNWRVYAQPVFFDDGSSTIRPADDAYLDTLRNRLSRVQTLYCVGTTDYTGFFYGDAYVAQHRAEAVCDYLTNAIPVDSAVVNNAPPNDNNGNGTEAARAHNRRVDIRLDY